jgi:hypothetical protein
LAGIALWILLFADDFCVLQRDYIGNEYSTTKEDLDVHNACLAKGDCILLGNLKFTLLEFGGYVDSYWD